MGRTNIVIDDVLIKRVMAITGSKSKREAVQLALQKIVSKASLFNQIKKFKGKLNWRGDLDQWRKSRV